MMKKYFPLAGVITITVIVIALTLLGSGAGGGVRRAAEVYVPRYTGTSLQMGDTSLSLIGEEMTLDGLTLGSPKGFTAPHVFKAAKVTLVVDAGTLADPVVHFRRLALQDAEIVYEPGNGTSNLRAIRDNIAKAVSRATVTTPLPVRKIVVDSVEIVAANLRLFPASTAPATALPAFSLTLRDIGKATGGASADQAALEILDKTTAAIVAAIDRSRTP